MNLLRETMAINEGMLDPVTAASYLHSGATVGT